VGSRVVTLGDVEGLLSGVVDRLVDVADLDELLDGRSEEGECGSELSLWVIGLDSG
jgi:hypothetical protein